MILKKIMTIWLCALLMLSMAFPVAAAEKTAAAGGILIPFSVTDSWDISTPDSISQTLQEKRALGEHLIRDYMLSFHYSVWFLHNRSDTEMIVLCRESQGADYQSLSSENLNRVVSARCEELTAAEPVTLDKVQTYRSGDVLYVKYTLSLEGSLYSTIFETVNAGRQYEVRLITREGKATDAVLGDFQRVADQLAAALTNPSQYEKAPETTVVPPASGSGNVVIDLEGEGSDVPDSSGASNSDSSPAASTAAEPENLPGGDPGVIEIGTDGVTLVLEETFPADDSSSGRSKSTAAVIGAAAMLVILTAIVVIFAVRKKSGSSGKTN